MKYLLIFALILPLNLKAKTATNFDGFVDLYYAYDFNEPTNYDREYTTQPARHNEFNANLVMLGVEHQRKDLKARLSFQAGTYVQSNYAAEPNVGSVSGGDLSRHIQDAFITYEASKETSFIAGIFPSHIGYEHVLSINNYTYTRSLAADFSPYYQSGVGVIHSLSDSWSVEGYLINGWQNISEDDSNKAIGSALRYQSENFSFNYTNFFGRYLQKGMQFHDFNIIVPISKKLEFKSLFDLGIREDSSAKTRTFYTFNLQGYYHFNKAHAASMRYELYDDPYQLNVTTPPGTGFEVHAISLGYDRTLNESFMWRTEYKHLISEDDVFTSESGLKKSNNFIVFSIASRF